MTELIEHQGEEGRPIEAAPERMGSPLDVSPEAFNAALERRGTNRSALMEWIRNALVDGVDYGSVPTKRGPSKPTLRKPGAEKICGMLGVSVSLPSLEEYEKAALSGVDVQSIILRCHLIDGSGHVVADGVGARRVKQDNGDLNKALKMAAKSAHIDATLRMAGLSEIFTQDLEDMPQDPPEKPKRRRVSSDQRDELERLLAAAGVDRNAVYQWAKIGDFGELTTDGSGSPETDPYERVRAELAKRAGEK